MERNYRGKSDPHCILRSAAISARQPIRTLYTVLTTWPWQPQAPRSIALIGSKNHPPPSPTTTNGPQMAGWALKGLEVSFITASIDRRKMDSTVRYLGVELDGALEIAESIEI